MLGEGRASLKMLSPPWIMPVIPCLAAADWIPLLNRHVTVAAASALPIEGVMDRRNRKGHRRQYYSRLFENLTVAFTKTLKKFWESLQTEDAELDCTPMRLHPCMSLPCTWMCLLQQSKTDLTVIKHA